MSSDETSKENSIVDSATTNKVDTSTTNSSSASPPHIFNLHLVDIDKEIIGSWKDELSKLPTKHHSTDTTTSCLKVHIYENTFQSVLKSNSDIQCLVSPANSFGLMDGGIDYYISEYYGGVDKLIPVVQKRIERNWCGEQNVGSCLLVDVRDLVNRLKKKENVQKNYPSYIAHCPTMRTPKKLKSEDDIVYRCTWAMLTSIRKHNLKILESNNGSKKQHERINNVLCAGFGTGVGRVPAKHCAKQMFLAVQNFNECPANNNVFGDDGNDESITMKNEGNDWLVEWSYARKIESSVQSLLRKEDFF
nr:3143_t:CDS:2 [Entrophospora candida]